MIKHGAERCDFCGGTVEMRLVYRHNGHVLCSLPCAKQVVGGREWHRWFESYGRERLPQLEGRDPDRGRVIIYPKKS